MQAFIKNLKLSFQLLSGNRRKMAGVIAGTLALSCLMQHAEAQVSVLTQHNDIARTGQNLNETILSTSNVAVSQFGKLFTRTVSGDITGQPLYISNLNIPAKGTHNVVYVATSNNNVYAFDADNPSTSTPLWQVNLGATVDGSLMGANDASTSSYPAVAGWHTTGGTYGVQSTPVIDPSTGTLYVCAAQTISSQAQYVLHALDVTTGAEKFGGPAVISGSVSGTGEQSVGGIVSFHADRELQRPGLLLVNGKIYLGFGGHADMEPLHGWVIAYDASVLGPSASPAAVFCTTPNGGRGAIWQSGQGMSADASGNVFASTGDGTFDANTGGFDYGDSILQLTPSLALTKYFTPFNQNLMAWYQDTSNNWQGDLDLGSSCLLLIPGSNLAFQGSKDGKIYEVDRTDLSWGYNSSGDTQIVDSFQAGTSTFSLWTAQQAHDLIYWNGPSASFVYAWPDSQALQAYQFSGSTLVHPTSILGADTGGGFADLSVSANGSATGSGILWASTSIGPDLRAYDASNVATELWNSTQNSSRDALPSQSKWAVPTVANGKVYVATTSNQLVVYGLLGLYAPAALRAAGGGGVVSLSWNSSPGNTSYNVKRSTNSGGPYTTIASGITDYDAGPASAPRLIGTYLDLAVTNGTPYYYVVTAVNASGESLPTSEVTATPTAPATTQAAIANAVSAPPTIDGDPSDAVWATTQSYPCRNVFLEVPSSTTDCSGNFKVAWDNTNFYVLFTVTDDVLVNDSVNPWDDDDTEFYIDTTNSRATSYGPQDFEYSFPWNDTVVWEQHGHTTGVVFAQTNTAGGYIIEAKIPWTTLSMTPSAGMVIGLDAAIAEDDDGGSRDARLAWIDNNNDDWHLPSIFGTGLFLSAIPPAPVGLTATAGDTQVSLNWTATTGATSYNVKRATISGGPYTTVASPTTNSDADTGLTNGTTYYYVVSAVNNGGESANSSEASATPEPPAPATPTSLTATAGDTQVTLGWTVSVGATSYNVKRATASGGPYTTVASPTTNSDTDTGLTNGVTYFYVVSALNAGGESGNSSEASATPEPPIPSAPTGLTATAGDTQVVLGWTASTGATSYNVKRSTITGGPYTTVSSPTTNSYTNTGLTNGTTYYYVVSAVNGGGESANSSEASATPEPPIPGIPTGLTATAGDTQVVLGWTASSGAASYNVKRATATGGPYTTVASPTTNGDTDTGLTNGTTYYYVVSAVNGGGESGNSSEASATPEPPIPGTPTSLTATAGDTQVTLGWTASTGATSYNVKRGTATGGPYTTVATPTTASFTDTGLTNGTTYFYVVSAVNGGGESANSSEASATPEPPVAGSPTGLTATAGDTQVVLAWTVSSGATTYNVKRATISGGPYTTVASPATNGYTDTGLTNGTNYFYVVTAVNGGGESANSSEANATPEPPVPGAPTGLSATGGDTQVSLAWTIDSGATSYNVRRSTITGGPYTTVASPATNSYTDTGLTNGTAYFYVVSAVDGGGESANSAESGATPEPPIPAVPTGLTATAGDTRIVLAWTVSTGATGYNVKRATITGGPYTTVASPTANGYTDTGLTNGTVYFYVVSALNGGGESGNSSEASAMPEPPIPAVPTGLTATAGDTQVVLAWTASTGAISYNVKRGTATGGPYTTVASPTTASFTDNGLTNGTTYFYVVTAVNGGGESGNSTQASATPQPPIPAAPTGLTATAGDTQVSLSWAVTTGATSYNVKRGTATGGPYTTVASPATNSYTNTGLTNGVTYYYVVSAVNGGGESANSSEASATPEPPIPSAPTGLTATAGDTQVSLSWAVTTGATSYNVKRGTTTGGPYTTVASPTTNSYTNTGLTNGTTYFYVVSAVNGGGESGNSSEASATPEPPIPAIPTGLTATAGDTQVVLGWTASTGATSYNVKRGTATGGPYTTVASPTTNSYTDTGLTDGVTYYYVVTATNAGGTSANSVQVSATPEPPAPPAPTGLTAVSGNTLVALNWNTSPGATSYNVKRSTTSGGPYVTVSSPTANSYTDTGLTNNVIYYYVVTAVNGGGQSANSIQSSATPGVPPATPTGLNAAATTGQVALDWNTSTGATSYSVKRSTTSGGPYTTIATGIAPNPPYIPHLFYTDTSVVNGTTYYYVVSAVSGCCESPNSSQVSATPHSNGPTGLTAIGGDARITLAWSAISGSTSYNVKRSTITGGPYTTVGNPATNSYIDTGLTNGTFYYYVVSAINGTGGETLNSSEASAIPRAAPSAPTGLVATAGDTRITITWNVATGAATYNVKRSTINGGPYSAVATGVTPISQYNPTVSYTDTGLTNNTTYYYVVSGVNPIGEGPNSNQASATPVAVSPTGLVAIAGNAQVSLSWNAETGATSYNLFSSTTSGGPYTAVVTGLTTTSYINTGLTNGTTYYYVVTAIISGVQTGNSNQASATPQGFPAAPTGLTATASSGRVDLGWPTSQGAASYNVKRSTADGGPYTTIATGIVPNPPYIPRLSYTDTAVTNGTTYYYVVSAVNAFGESPNSNQASALPQASGPTGLAAVSGNTQVSLTWNAYSGATGYNVKRSTGGAFTTIAPGITANSYIDTGLTNGTTYYYVVSAIVSGVQTVNSNQATGTPQAVPNAPTNLVSTVGNTQTTLTWNVTAGAVNYNLKRSTINGGPYTTIASGLTPQPSYLPIVNYTNTGLTNGTTYYYVATAVNAFGEGPPSNQTSVTPQGPGPTGLTATAGTLQISLSWNSYLGAISYNIKRSTTNGGPYTTITTGVTALTYTDTGATSAITYYYVISAVTSNGQTANSNQASAVPITTQPPPAPAGLVANPSNGQVSLVWNDAFGAASYNVKRSTTNGGPYTTIATGVLPPFPGSSFIFYIDTAVTHGTTYYYVVSGVNSAGQGPNSSQVSGTP